MLLATLQEAIQYEDLRGITYTTYALKALGAVGIVTAASS
jgi:hypothetical protein